MSAIPTPENIKEKAKLLRKILSEKNNADLSHGQCIEIVSQLFGFKDWNTAAAKLKPNHDQLYPLKIGTIGDLKKAIAPYDDTASVFADYRFKVREFLDGLEPDELDFEDCIRDQDFSLRMNSFEDDLAIFQLVLEHESIEF